MKIDQTEIKNFYNEINEIWDIEDLWHMHSHKVISQFLKKEFFERDNYILNAGSGGNDYGLQSKIHHVDIADKKILDCDNYTVASIEHMPFEDSTFDHVICVGSVLNYCDAMATINELSRVMKSNGKLVLEFESSFGYEYRKKNCYMQDASIVTVQFRGQDHKQWLYSPIYISNILKQNKFSIIRKKHFHILSSWKLSKGLSENDATKFAKYDPIFSMFPMMKKHSNNIILTCLKA